MAQRSCAGREAGGTASFANDSPSKPELAWLTAHVAQVEATEATEEWLEAAEAAEAEAAEAIAVLSHQYGGGRGEPSSPMKTLAAEQLMPSLVETEE